MVLKEKKGKYSSKNITFILKGYGYTGNSMAKLLGCSAPTGLKKINNPLLLTLDDLMLLSRDGVDIKAIFNEL